MARYSRNIEDVVLAAGDSDVAVRDIVFTTPEETRDVVRACDVGLCRLVPHIKQRTYLLDPHWGIKTAIILTRRGEIEYDKADQQRAGV